MKNYVQRGDTITVAAPATTTGGAVVTIGELVGIAAGDAATGQPLDVVTVGVFDLPKVGTDVIAVGDLVFADGDGLVTVEEDDGGTPTPVAFTPLGLAVTAAGSGVASVHVKIG